MDKYEELIAVFSDILKESQDYHIAHIYHAGYVAVVGEIDVANHKNSTTFFVDEFFDAPEKMAESLLRNWRWQWFYRHKQNVGKMDYKDIQELDKDVPEDLKEDYLRQLQELEQKIDAILGTPA
ncbi:MAG: hypothetical protein J1E98_00345 [Lachnospiraceae bacterium]|nr:hypothetical protein [Lachnospiraceae bacterium]